MLSFPSHKRIRKELFSINTRRRVRVRVGISIQKSAFLHFPACMNERTGECASLLCEARHMNFTVKIIFYFASLSIWFRVRVRSSSSSCIILSPGSGAKQSANNGGTRWLWYSVMDYSKSHSTDFWCEWMCGFFFFRFRLNLIAFICISNGEKDFVVLEKWSERVSTPKVSSFYCLTV